MMKQKRACTNAMSASDWTSKSENILKDLINTANFGKFTFQVINSNRQLK
jgi:hypothetical protein